MHRPKLWQLTFILFAFLADRLTKAWAVDLLATHGPGQMHPWLSITEVYNEGIALGMFQGIGPWMGWGTILIIIGLLVLMRRLPNRDWLVQAGLALIIGGALGNMVDRITVGRVLDFIVVPLRPGIFNVADVMIQLGIGVAVLGALLSDHGRKQKSERPGTPLPNS